MVTCQGLTASCGALGPLYRISSRTMFRVMLNGRRTSVPERMVAVVFGVPGGASEVPANSRGPIDGGSWSEFADSQIGRVADIDGEVHSIASWIPASIDGLPESSFGSPRADLPFRVLPSLAGDADSLREAFTPLGEYALFPDKPITRVEIAEDTANRLQGGLVDVADHAGSGSVSEAARAAAEKVQVVRDALAAWAEGGTASVSAEQPGAANGVAARAMATETLEHPSRTSFPLTEGPGGQIIAQVSPKPVPATVLVASPSYGEVRVTGMASWFPAHTVHAKDCGTVVDGNDCTLTSTDHIHVRTVSVSLEPLTETGSRGQAALAALAKDPTDKGIDKFQDEMRRMTDKAEHGETQASLPATQTHLTIVSGAAAVQQGDGSCANITTHVVIERVELPVCDLFAEDRALVNAFIEAVLGPEGGPEAGVFGREALRVAGRTDDLALLGYSTELHGAESSVFGLFGVDAIRRAPAVMIGTSNTLHTDMRVEQGKYVLGGGLAGLDRIRQDASQIRPVQAAAGLAQPHLFNASPGNSAIGEPGQSLPAIENLRRIRRLTGDQARAVQALHQPGAIGGISSIG